MNIGESGGMPSLKKIGGITRRAVSVSQESLVHAEPLFPDKTLPLLIRPAVPGVSLASWAEANRPTIDAYLQKHGGILFRGFDIPRVEDFDHTVQAISGDLLEYKERSSPRHAVAGKIYTSTDYPPSEPIFLHNENSYQKTWPMRIFFFCNVQPTEGGETPIADTRRVYERIDPAVRQEFAEKGWMYVRNFGDGFGLPWQEVFQTEDKAAVEAHCQKSGIQVEWKEGDRLRTRAVRRALTAHPQSGEMVWFNHATFFNVSTLTPRIREALLDEFSEEDLPTNTYYGDGTPIEPEVLDHLRACYNAETVSFPWEKGDLLMLDNMMVAHGRAPFKGQRQILVGMSHAVTWDDMPAPQ
jgi:alpha-ketoglutarate-dependent taurine dioxygenase